MILQKYWTCIAFEEGFFFSLPLHRFVSKKTFAILFCLFGLVIVGCWLKPYLWLFA